MRVAAIADLHCGISGTHEMLRILDGVRSDADVLVLGGDLTNLGLPEEAEALLAALSTIGLPTVAVLGNHDHESGYVEEISALLRAAGVVLLDGSVWEHDGVGFAGVKGFGAGFTPHRLSAFGEAAIKDFVAASIHEAIALDHALGSLQTHHRVVVLHYSPIASTLRGEPPEIYPFLGDSLLEEVVDRHGADAVVHGHAHEGVVEGFTAGGVPVYNVSRQVLCRHAGEQSYVTFEVPGSE